MNILLNFHLQNLYPYENQSIREEFAFNQTFGEILEIILNKYCPKLTLDQIAVLSDKNYIFTFGDLSKTLGEIMGTHLTDYILKPRQEVNGPNLMGLSDTRLKNAISDEISLDQNETLSITEEVEADNILSMEDRKDSIQKEKISSKPSTSPSLEPIEKESDKRMPPSPPGAPSEILSELGSAGAVPTPPSAPKPAPKSEAPLPPPPPTIAAPVQEYESSLDLDRDSTPKFRSKKKQAKRSKSSSKSLTNREESKRESIDFLDDSEFPEKVEGEEELNEEFAKYDELLEQPMEKKKDPTVFHKNIAIDYFSVMNPEKYYPMVINIADLEQMVKQDQENILTGERKTQKKDAMEVALLSPIVTVVPIFPGCNVTPLSIQTNFENPEDEITFYITPLVNDDLDECKINFVNSENQIVHSVPTPSKVQDPRYARTVALYGTLASVIPKILIIFGIEVDNLINASTIKPLLESLVGAMSFTNLIGYFGIGLALVISAIIYFTRKPKSVLRRYKLQDLRRKAKI
ncbi:hypothetical protein [Candidatus Lokiarchaeum ossiferum]|uniref:hypothetical protein n=1 Tax=Candidatus Lokiarchaeum ossiferum TaxID=2951803 RepID=UPI00352DEACD